MAEFNPARDITKSSLGNVLSPVGRGIANALNGAFPSLRNGLRSGTKNDPILTQPLADRRFVESSASSLVYPSDLPDSLAYFKLELKEYEKPSSDGGGKNGSPLGTIYLPLPSNINEAFAMEYNRAQFGPVLGDPEFLRTAGNVTNALSQGKARGEGDPAASRRREEASKFAENVTGSLPSFLLRAGVRAVLPTTGGAFSDLFTGSTPNPGFALLFQSNTFRSFQYSWRFAPERQEDSIKLNEIINTIKYAMHPGKEKLFLTFPCRAFPKMVVKGNDIFQFKPCVITAFNVNYAPSAVPSFFKDDGKPVEIDVSLALQETEILTRSDFKNEYKRSLPTGTDSDAALRDAGA